MARGSFVSLVADRPAAAAAEVEQQRDPTATTAGTATATTTGNASSTSTSTSTSTAATAAGSRRRPPTRRTFARPRRPDPTARGGQRLVAKGPVTKFAAAVGGCRVGAAAAHGADSARGRDVLVGFPTRGATGTAGRVRAALVPLWAGPGARAAMGPRHHRQSVQQRQHGLKKNTLYHRPSRCR